MIGLYPMFLRAAGNVARGLIVRCPICHKGPGTPCRNEDDVPEVHDQRESIAYREQRAP